MRVFDFDNTIYAGESIIDFYFFSIKKKPAVLKYAFAVIYHFLKYKLRLTTIKDMNNVAEKYAAAYIGEFDNIEELVEEFWAKNLKKIKSWYEVQEDDLLLTGSLNLIMNPLCEKLGIKNLICSEFDLETMDVLHVNFGRNKKEIFREKYGEDAIIGEFYTDHSADKPMFEISEKVFIVKGNRIKRVK